MHDLRPADRQAVRKYWATLGHWRAWSARGWGPPPNRQGTARRVGLPHARTPTRPGTTAAAGRSLHPHSSASPAGSGRDLGF
eukprot:9123976-Pyramimonas_sp.AAC.1